ncbi:hypothetical protein ACFRJ1_05860 [Streptomyces sp. NPDC056773]|uniref:hypothetical protein n=1 Tax=unclassified Streptomyces TaxID=2593676 RepID=UPI0036C3D234
MATELPGADVDGSVRQLDAQLSRAGEVRAPLVHGDEVRLPASPATLLPVGVQAPEHPVPQVPPAHGEQLCVHVVGPGPVDRTGHVGGVGEHLARDAARVQAGSAEPPLLDDGHVEAGEGIVDDGVAGTRTDDDEIVLAHRARLRARVRPGSAATRT